METDRSGLSRQQDAERAENNVTAKKASSKQSFDLSLTFPLMSPDY